MHIRSSIFGSVLAVAGLFAITQDAKAFIAVDYEGISFPGLSATGMFTFTDISNDPYDVDLEIVITNTDDTAAGISDSTITAFTFDLAGTIIQINFDQTNGWSLLVNDDGDDTTLPQISGVFGFCVQDDANPSCNGNNPNNGIEAGNSLTFGFEIDTLLTAAELEAAQNDYDGSSARTAVRWQEVDVIDGPQGRSDTSVGTPPTDVPEPGTLGLIGVGLAGLGWMARRRRKAA